jgi:hypothetical protein
MLRKRLKGESRTSEELREHYLVEKELADRLRNASQQDRGRLYTSVNDEICRRVANLPLVARKASPELTAANVARKIALLERFLREDSTFLEIGPGDCALSLEVAKRVRCVYAVDVCTEITSGLNAPPNYSYSLMEHLHPDDSLVQLRNIYRALTRGGVYVCVTPNRLTGPHDISRYFEPTAAGLHLQEYTASELSDLLRKVGFSKTEVYVGGVGRYVRPPLLCVRWVEKTFDMMPHRLRAMLVDWEPIIGLFGVRLVARK